MDQPHEIRDRAAQLPDGDVVKILLEQHLRIREMFEVVLATHGPERQQRFDELRGFLAVHETAEEMVLRPVTAQTHSAIAQARNEEEAEANAMLAGLEELDVTSADFEQRLREFQTAVVTHAEAEEHEELPTVLETCDEQKRQVMGKALFAAEAVGPTHPHPSTAGSPAAQWVAGPFASMVDRTRDAIKAVLG